MAQILEELYSRKAMGKKSIAVLIDPDKVSDQASLARLLHLCVESKVDYFFVGGSLITTNTLSQVIHFLKTNGPIPVVLFPGSNMHLDASADAILFLSLISGRNPELLIGQHVLAAPILRKSQLEVLPTGYMLVDSGRQTTVSYISNTTPIPSDKPEIGACTAMAGEMLGLKLMYLDAGSGAMNPIPVKFIHQVRRSVSCPLIVGGGINSPEKAKAAIEAGADVLVVGNGIEKNLSLLAEVSDVLQSFNSSLNVH
ncbi:geranylgeranylglyceryl/heptaprenylglyceryl phosphate synthase [Cytophagales bacterium LB-30]|uniref:Geranylgeranylglyceryl phosphate synthase n=1 Tax=Shiella aurantiaca TaxID=3058365 RepID=A0ABT8F6Y2_9BACT|nr:geranylgeranylglyceryl/heptaprenylglyceryl phosphate synthase [Shiella aurantiaca]MDN4165726.1 geranylgeranylglyceryl/heptaprenylglyceryl phosphate synthase [Shiella aurantiaca]